MGEQNKHRTSTTNTCTHNFYTVTTHTPSSRLNRCVFLFCSMSFALYAGYKVRNHMITLYAFTLPPCIPTKKIRYMHTACIVLFKPHHVVYESTEPAFSNAISMAVFSSALLRWLYFCTSARSRSSSAARIDKVIFFCAESMAITLAETSCPT